MSTVSQPFGLRPAYSPSGVVRPTAYTMASGYGVNILQNQPVKIGTDGNIQAAAIGERFIGTFQGVEFTDSDGRRRVSNKWTASAVASSIVAYVTLDPSIVYEIQANGPIQVTDIGRRLDHHWSVGSDAGHGHPDHVRQRFAAHHRHRSGSGQCLW